MSAAGKEGRGANHFDGSMDESSYHFSEDAVSVDGAAQSPMGVNAGAAGMTRSERGVWGRDDEYSESAAAAAAGGVLEPPRAAGEDDDSPGYRQQGGVGDDGVDHDDSGSSGQFSGRGGRGHVNTANALDDDDIGDGLGDGSGGSGAAAAGQNYPR